MKKAILNNWSLKLLSLIIALVIWLIIVNYDNPNTTRVISGIPIDVLGTETLTANDMTYRVAGNQTASVRVRCPRRLAQQLKVADFRATADFSQLYSFTNQVPVVITCTNSRVLDEYLTQITQSLEVTIEDIITRQIDVGVNVGGTPSDGCQVGEVTPSPSVVTVRAPESIANQISAAGVSVDVNTLSESTTLHASLDLYNAGGSVIDTTGMDSLELSSAEIAVAVEIENVKNVSIAYTVAGQDSVAKGYRYAGSTITPETVKVAGRKIKLLDLKSISLPEGELDVTGSTETVEKNYQLSDLQLPEGISLVDSPETEIHIELLVEKLETKTFELDLSRVTEINLDDSLQIANEDAKLSVTVEGLASDLAALEASEISGTLDLAGLTEGTYSVTAEVSVPDGFRLVGTAAIRLQLVPRENEEKEEETTEEETTALPAETTAEEKTAAGVNTDGESKSSGQGAPDATDSGEDLR